MRRAAEGVRAAAAVGGQEEACAHLAGALAAYRGVTLAGYLPIGSEIDPRPVMAAHEGPVCVPVMVGRGRPLRFRRWAPGCALERGPFGVMVPERGEWLMPEALIVPLLAFDARGARLGYGGGYYDRTLAALRGQAPVLAIGFAFAAQEVRRVPVEATDEPLDRIVTERGAVRPLPEPPDAPPAGA